LLAELSVATQVNLPELSLSSDEMMNWEQIREALASGMSIGSHTHTHRVLSTLSLSEQSEELSLSKSILEQKLNTVVQSIAYPVGGHRDCSSDTGRIAEESGYLLGFSFQTGFNDSNQICPFEVGRVSAEMSVPLTAGAVTFPNVFARSRCNALKRKQVSEPVSLKSTIKEFQ
jgi:peptidoglycan/xylan/chitin deacetylase (PgdA/CDA1 family)